MANLKDIRDRIKSVKSIQKVTKAMKMVAAAKMRRAQENMEQARPYSSRLTEIIQNLLPDVDLGLLPLLNVREVKRVAYVVVTSDKGLAGSFNSSVLRKSQNEIDELGKKPETIINPVDILLLSHMWIFGIILISTTPSKSGTVSSVIF